MTDSYGSLAKVVSPSMPQYQTSQFTDFDLVFHFLYIAILGVSITIVLRREKVCLNLEFVVHL